MIGWLLLGAGTASAETSNAAEPPGQLDLGGVPEAPLDVVQSAVDPVERLAQPVTEPLEAPAARPGPSGSDVPSETAPPEAAQSEAAQPGTAQPGTATPDATTSKATTPGPAQPAAAADPAAAAAPAAPDAAGPADAGSPLAPVVETLDPVLSAAGDTVETVHTAVEPVVRPVVDTVNAVVGPVLGPVEAGMAPVVAAAHDTGVLDPVAGMLDASSVVAPLIPGYTTDTATELRSDAGIGSSTDWNAESASGLADGRPASPSPEAADPQAAPQNVAPATASSTGVTVAAATGAQPDDVVGPMGQPSAVEHDRSAGSHEGDVPTRPDAPSSAPLAPSGNATGSAGTASSGSAGPVMAGALPGQDAQQLLASAVAYSWNVVSASQHGAVKPPVSPD